MISNRIIKQFEFIQEIEKLKLIFRANKTLDAERQENSAEHSWHISVMAVLLIEYTDEQKIDLLKVVKMLLIHDIVEIDSGDINIFSKDQKNKLEKEKLGAERIFSLLPEDQAKEYKNLWLEFEARETEEAKYAKVIDGLQPLINHLVTGDTESMEMEILLKDVIQKKMYIKEFTPQLWEITQNIIDKSFEVGLYK